MKVIGNKMKVLRLEKGLTQVELCRRTGIRPSTMSLIETGVIVPESMLRRLPGPWGSRLRRFSDERHRRYRNEHKNGKSRT